MEPKDLGLTKYELIVYKCLVKTGVLTARDISERSKVPYTAIYPQLKSLLSKGLIACAKGEETLYFAIKPSIGLKSYVEKRAEELDALQKSMSAELDRVFNSEKVKKNSEFNVVYGIEPSHNISLNMIHSSSKRLMIFGWAFAIKKNLFTFLREFKNAKERGVTIQMIITDKEQLNIIRMHKKYGVNLRYLDLKHFSLMIRDSEECKITLKSPELEQRFSIHMMDKPLSESFEEYFKMLWSKAEKI